MSTRILKYSDAIREATEQVMAADESVFMIGEGVGDPKQVFGTTTGLKEKFPKRVFDSPVSENGVTGVCIGAALGGFRPILVHQRMDFSLYSADQLINNAAKWYSMFGGHRSVPLVVRMIIGRGFGAGNQHSQNLAALYAHVPGLKVVFPSSAYTAKGLLVAAIKDPNPVIFLEHRWLGNTTSEVPESIYELPIGKARVALEGRHITIVSSGYATVEALKAAECLRAYSGVYAEVIDLLSLSPIDFDAVQESYLKTQELLVVDHAWKTGGVADTIMSEIGDGEALSYPDFPSPSTPGLCKDYYNGFEEIVYRAIDILGLDPIVLERKGHVDVPDDSFRGPF